MTKTKKANAPKYAKWVVVRDDREYRVIGTFFFHYRRDADRLAEDLMSELGTAYVYLLPIKEWRECNE